MTKATIAKELTAPRGRPESDNGNHGGLAHLRYGDTFVKLDGAWLFAERNLYVDWIETKSSHP